MTESRQQSRRTNDSQIVDELQQAVALMHVVSNRPRIIVAATTRFAGPRPMAWQVLLERMLALRTVIRYRGVASTCLRTILSNGFDSHPTLDPSWSHERLGDALKQGSVIQLFRGDRLPDDVENALAAVLIFAEGEGMAVDGVRAMLAEHPGNAGPRQT